MVGQRKIVISILFFGIGVGASISAAQTVRVKLAHLNFPLQVQGVGISITGIKTSDIKNVAIPREEIIKIDLRKIINEKTWLIEKGSAISRLQQKYIEITSTTDKARISGYQFPTPVLISQSGDIISALQINTYLEGVLAGEMPSSWPLEALKAQAVAARSYTLFQINQRKNQPFQLDGSILDQVFAATENSGQLDKIKRALDETDGMVLMKQDQVLKAYYHSDCGGRTEDPDLVWGGGKSKVSSNSVTDQHCAISPQSKWSYEISLNDLQKKLQSSFDTLRVVSRSPSGRVASIALTGAKTGVSHVLVSGNELRHILGFAKLKSTLFSISREKDMVTFSGRGFGHGSGLCQYGARFMAENGADVREILRHYYPSANVTDH